MKKFIIDSNILFACLIRDSTTRKMIFDHAGRFMFPADAFDELDDHRTEIIQKSSLTEETLDKLIPIIASKLTIIPSDQLIPFFAEASAIVDKIDPDDMIFIACALAFPESILWSDDKKLKQQSKVKVFDTKEMMSFFARDGN